jgi:hypothetical protein
MNQRSESDMSLLSSVDVVPDGQSAYPSWYRAPFWAHDQIFFSFLLPENCFGLRLGAACLTRGRVYNVQCTLSVVTVAEDS